MSAPGQLDGNCAPTRAWWCNEGINARALKFEDIGRGVDLSPAIVSFISVNAHFCPAAVPLLRPAGQMVILIKPQFEAGRGTGGKGGIVRGSAIHQLLAASRADRAALGFETNMMESPILGAEGNKEFLLYAHH